ncbi:hypothetical protein GH714_010120 [Hevea brasiliensis]|uniref:C2 NT-type domain-containing protein n=1 Tax=Hevea brasiliensis TaxID=3981 RepID=A0A6A6MLT3_HEVBR|nr:hypothetical protein GH714_010120 [Hevea brasiliensis]
MNIGFSAECGCIGDVCGPWGVGKPTARLEKGILKNSLVGVSIDLANYAEATKASTVSLPLRNSKSNGVLHVSIQRLQGVSIKELYRDVEETDNTDIQTQNRTLNAHLSNGEEGSKSNSNEDSTSFPSSQSHASVPHKPIANVSAKIYEENRQSQWEWSADSDHGICIDDSISGSLDNLTAERSQHNSDIEIEKLKDEIVSLARQIDLSELELQTLRKQIVKESKRGQDLSREVMSLKEERHVLKAECEKLKAFQKRIEEAKSKISCSLRVEMHGFFLKKSDKN